MSDNEDPEIRKMFREWQNLRKIEKPPRSFFHVGIKRFGLLVTVSACIAVLFWIADNPNVFLNDWTTWFKWGISIATAIVIIGSSAQTFFNYLGGANADDGTSVFEKRVAALEKRNAELLFKVNQSSNAGVDVDALAKQIKEIALDQAGSEVMDSVEKKLKNAIREDVLEARLNASSARLSVEVDSLKKGSFVNLYCGIVLGTVGIGLMVWVAIESNWLADNKPFFPWAIPRISVALLTEFLAYFFLNLYKSAAGEVRYYQNEITNCEALATCLSYARIETNEKAMGLALAALAKTERNFVLLKGQSTVHLTAKQMEIDASNAEASRLENLAVRIIEAANGRRDGDHSSK